MVEQLSDVLDATLAALQADSLTAQQHTQMLQQLNSARDGSPDTWPSTIAACRQHPLHQLALLDPLTRRAFNKPRGYAGDAVMLDMMYDFVQPSTPSLIAQLNHASTTPDSVRLRLQLAARTIDDAARGKQQCRVASLACGHLREAIASQAVQSGAALVYAIDQDDASLTTVSHDHKLLQVVPLHASVKQVLARGMPATELDLAYSLGLYDYLPDPVASRVTWALFQSLAPGGKLLVGNFTPDNEARGYMEAFMDWHLTYRSEAQLLACTQLLDYAQVEDARTYADAHGNIAYLEVTRKLG